MRRIGQILPSLFSDFGIEDSVKLRSLRKKWYDIFSSPLTEHTFPKDLKNDTIIVTVNSHVWLNELKLLKDEFVKKLHPYGIKNVEFRFGRICRNQDKKTNEKNIITLTKEQEEWIRNIVKNIRDDEIRSTTESLIKKYLLFVNQIEQKTTKN